jgi:hypothetical protein
MPTNAVLGPQIAKYRPKSARLIGGAAFGILPSALAILIFVNLNPTRDGFVPLGVGILFSLVGAYFIYVGILRKEFLSVHENGVQVDVHGCRDTMLWEDVARVESKKELMHFGSSGTRSIKHVLVLTTKDGRVARISSFTFSELGAIAESIRAKVGRSLVDVPRSSLTV